MGIYEAGFYLYNLLLIPVIFFSLIFYNLAVTSIFFKQNIRRFKNNVKGWPSVTIQIPTYNDAVVVRCLKHVLKFDYPQNKFHIIVADDSSDPKTRSVIDNFVNRYPEKIKVVRRDSRKGFKSGALNNSLEYAKGEIIVIFDADFTPKKDFLKKIVAPMLEDKKIGIVQGKMDYINMNQNLITKIASVLLIIYYQVIMPINNRLKIVFFCGHSGAIRKDLLLKVGGWNENSITEDTDLSLKLLKAGYKSVYLSDVVVPGEVPFTLLSFVKQQMRWTYGNTRVFLENALSIWVHKKLTFLQKLMMSWVLTFGNIVSLFVIWMTFFAVITMLTGVPKAFTMADAVRFLTTYLATGGFLSLAIVAVHKEKKTHLVKSTLIGAPTVGLVVTLTNTVAFLEAVLGIKMKWFKTPKYGNISILNWFAKNIKG